MELVDFLRARLDEDEERLDAIDHVQAPAGHMARERREVEAKRQIVERYHYEATSPFGEKWRECATCGAANEPWPCPTLRLLALPYADHPDYSKAWRS